MRRFLPPIAAAGLPLLVCVALTWPLVLHLGTSHPLTAFGDSHAWVMDRLGRAFAGEGWFDPTCMAGYPDLRAMRLIGWVPALLAVPLRAALGALGAANAVQLLGLPATGLAAWALLRRWTDADSWICALTGASFALGPTFLATFGAGELSNAQGWILPVALLALDSLRVQGGRLVRLQSRAGIGGLGAVFAGGLCATFTSPYYALALPLLAVGWAVAQARSWRVLPPLGALALGLLPGLPYYTLAGGGDSVFSPARRGLAMPESLAWPAPVATPDGLLWASERLPGSPFEVTHVAYLGLALVIAVLAALAWRGRGWKAGLALVVGGLVLAAGPTLAVGQGYPRFDGHVLSLPVALLEAVGYPTRQGGLYFRYVVIAALGAHLVVAGGLSRWRWGALGAALLLVLQVADGVRATGPYWPRPVEEVGDRVYLEGIRGADGAVLELPLQGPADAVLGQGALLRAVLHGRPTTGLPRDVLQRNSSQRRLATGAAAAADSRAALRAAGVRFLLLPADLRPHLDPDARALVAALGPPDHSGVVLAWDAGPTVAVCVDHRGR